MTYRDMFNELGRQPKERYASMQMMSSCFVSVVSNLETVGWGLVFRFEVCGFTPVCFLWTRL